MIIAENQIRVAGKIYKTKINCVTIRRLTTLEFLFLSCVNKFSNNQDYKDIYVKSTFENIFQFQNSELLLKPCITSLKNIGVLDDTDAYGIEYSKVKFSQFKLTSLGENMLSRGRMLGESREIVNDIHYNPITRSFNSFEGLNHNQFLNLNINHIGRVEFPSEDILKGLEDGFIMNHNYIASKYNIQSIELDDERSWDSCYSSFKVNYENDQLSLIPSIENKKVENDIIKQFTTHDFDENFIKNLGEFKNSDVETIVGSGNKIKENVFSICKNSKYIMMPLKYFDLYSEYLNKLSGKVYFLFGATKFKIVQEEKNILIYIPEMIGLKNCIVINSLNEHLCLSKNECEVNGDNISFPIAYTDLNIVTSSDVLKESIVKLVSEKFTNDWTYLSLIAFAPFRKSFNIFQKLMIENCKNKKLNTILENIKKVKDCCNSMNLRFFDIEFMSDILFERLTKLSIQDMISSLQFITDSKIISKSSDLYKKLFKDVLESLSTPKSYSDVSAIFNILKIENMDEALVFDEFINPLYNKNVITNMIAITLTKPEFKFSEFFEMDIFFNEYLESIKEISTLTIVHDIYSESNKKLLLDSVQNCPDVAKLKSNLEKLHSKQADLVEFGINIFEEMNRVDSSKTKNFYDNIHFIEKTLDQMSEGVFRKSEDDVEQVQHVDKKIYVVDTCAIINNPQLFQYFAEDEYVRIPTKVIDELGKIKDKRKKYSEESSSIARIFCREVTEVYLTYFNKNEKVRFYIENVDPKLLPIDLDKETPDNLILTVALKYKNWDVCLISDDGQFKLTAHSQNIPSMSSKEFINSHLNNFVDKKKIVDEVEKIKVRQKNKLNENKSNVQTQENENIDFSRIDDLSIKKIQNYIGMLNVDSIAFLEANKIKTIKDYRLLTQAKFNTMKLKGKNSMRKDEILRSLKVKDEALKRMLADYE